MKKYFASHRTSKKTGVAGQVQKIVISHLHLLMAKKMTVARYEEYLCIKIPTAVLVGIFIYQELFQ
jgi:hypothetical protein